MATSGLVVRQRQIPVVAATSSLGCNGVDEETIQIFLAMGKSLIPMRILTSDTIASVKMRIQSLKKGMYVKHQKLVHDGRELARDDSRVKDYGIRCSDVIHLVVKVSEIVEVVVKSGGGREYVLKVERDPEALRQISDLEDQEVDENSLILRGKRVDDHRLISDLVVEDDAVVHVVANKTARFRARHVGRETELSIENRKPLKPPGEPFELGVSSCQVERELSDDLLEMVAEVNMGLEQGFLPVLFSAGTGGTYGMLDRFGDKPVAVFKPMDEEPMAENNPRGLPLSISGEGLKRGTKAGEGAFREVAAYILDHPRHGPRSRVGKNERGFAGVPPTVMIRCCHPAAFSEPEKLGSLQQFVFSRSSCEDMGPSRFPADEVHKIAILDIRLANTDRNGSNILVCESASDASLELVPIDHGYCLPHKFEDCSFEWLFWNQAKLPFSQSSLEYIASLDAEEDLWLLKEQGWKLGKEPARVLKVSTMLLKRGAEAGLSAFDIGSMMCRPTLNERSVIERLLEEVEACVLPESSEEAYMETVAQVIDFYLFKK